MACQRLLALVRIVHLLPPRPTFSEANLPALDGRVFIVTGGNAGVGFELVKMLYARGGCTIYITSRSPAGISAAIEGIKATTKTNQAPPAQLKSLVVDFGDLTTISNAASEFLAQEMRLDILWNNTDIAQAPPCSTKVQGYEAHIGTNCLGPHLFTQLLLPLLLKTAKTAPSSSVRIIYTSSGIVDMTGPPGGAGNWFLASELDRRTRQDGLVCVVQNPGNVKTKFWDPMGAYTELWAGLSEDLTTNDGGKFGGIFASLKAKEVGGICGAAEFWDWCEEQTKPFAS
ncbi:NAD(P)-binding protein [Lentithecium fluviatile CBS 122367]|uniref:NAD(P)-binding protein n=1 Tax=Lentithecium fluviatile CBS 122367 TaxID=1168545 RepID=A0A6G1IKR7_9PLEO|nr:NAD(P)-binding protein [Lentithecium fluviatile CBS 122367]